MHVVLHLAYRMYSRVPNKEEISVVQDTLMAATVTITTTTTTIKMPE